MSASQGRASFHQSKIRFYLHMSRFTKRKYVEAEVLNKYDLPSSNQEIVKITRSCGNNLHEVCTAEGQQYLVSMPSKFRKHIWVKRGNFVVIEPITEGVKVKGEIVQVLLKDQIKYFKDEGVWPKGFYSDTADLEDKRDENQSYSFDDECFVNTNRPCVEYPTSSSSSSSDEDD